MLEPFSRLAHIAPPWLPFSGWLVLNLHRMPASRGNPRPNLSFLMEDLSFQGRLDVMKIGRMQAADVQWQMQLGRIRRGPTYMS